MLAGRLAKQPDAMRMGPSQPVIQAARLLVRPAASPGLPDGAAGLIVVTR